MKTHQPPSASRTRFYEEKHTVIVLDTAEALKVYAATSLDDAPRQFMRLKIQRR